jgi:hypothetical protein
MKKQPLPSMLSSTIANPEPGPGAYAPAGNALYRNSEYGAGYTYEIWAMPGIFGPLRLTSSSFLGTMLA